MQENIIQRLQKKSAFISGWNSSPEKNNQVTSREFLIYLEFLFLGNNKEGLLELKSAATKPLQQILFAELENNADLPKRTMEIRNNPPIAEFLCFRSAPLVDLAHKSDQGVENYPFGNRGQNAVAIALSLDESEKKCTNWCKKVLQVKENQS